VLKSDHPCCSYLYGNTISPAEELVVQNYGVVASEYAVFAAAEKRYRTGVSMLPTPITEKIEVPTREAIGDVRLVAGKAAERAAELDPLIRWDVVEAQRDVLIEQGRRFFENALRLLRESGVDVEDPLRVFFALRAIGAGRLEELCHPGERDAGRPRGIVPFVPTELGVMTEQVIAAELEQIRAKGLGAALAGRCFVVASADTHSYGVYALGSVLRALGAEVIDLGAERDPEHVAEAAMAAGAATATGVRGRSAAAAGRRPAIAVSTHNGQCVGYSARLIELLKDAGCRCDVYIGGKLNTIVEGETEPSDACAMLTEIGAMPCRSIAELVEQAATS
jgi:methylmalonyl-CoA mutase cobalamin-binding subunit